MLIDHLDQQNICISVPKFQNFHDFSELSPNVSIIFVTAVFPLMGNSCYDYIVQIIEESRRVNHVCDFCRKNERSGSVYD